MNETYDIEFSYYYQIFSNFKIKECELLANIINGARIGEFINFQNYARITFDPEDKLIRYGHVELFDGFDRRKTNCMVFSIPRSQVNNNRYNKLFLYTHNNKGETFYGYILYNTMTGRCTQIADVSGEPNDIVRHLNNTIYGFNKSDEFEKQLEEKRKNGF